MQPLLSLRLRVLLNPQTRLHAQLLGPCFKTGRVSYQLATEQQLAMLSGNVSTLAEQ